MIIKSKVEYILEGKSGNLFKGIFHQFA